MKKGGAGGAYTWGSPMDQAGFESFGVSPVSGVTIASAPATTSTVVTSQPMNVSIQDASAFPTLGGAPVVSRGPVTSWGPTPATTVGYVTLGESSLRTGALDVVDGTHPRNTFAKKPYIRPATTVATTTNAGGMIDWSQAGMPEAVMKQILTASANTGNAHLGPYGQPAPPVALDTLRAAPTVTVQQQMYAPKVTKQTCTAPTFQQNRIIQQPGGRMR